MKHNLPPDKIDAASVEASLHAVGVSATPEQCDLIARHASMVIDVNARMNLTRITSRDDVLALHIVDSLAFQAYVGRLGGRIVDIGSGAGYPGMLLSILGLDVRLCESVKKKAAFLEQCVTDLGLSALVSAVRAEELAVSYPHSADVVVARAVSALSSLLELASPLLVMGGRLIALKGTPNVSELAAAASAAPLCGMVARSETRYTLPTGEERTVFVFERRGATAFALPRRTGMAQRQPLGAS